MPFHQPRVITRKKTYDVTIKCEENTSLDDRTEVINIKSDYWTGKKFTLTQKGTAYLEYEGVDMIEKNGNVPEVFSVLSNQKWTAKVTDGGRVAFHQSRSFRNGKRYSGTESNPQYRCHALRSGNFI